MTTTPLSPKVIAAALGGILATAILSNLQYITPELFHFLGGWGLFGYGLTISAAAGAAGYLKRDLVRDLGNQALADAGSAAQTLPAYPDYTAPAVPAAPEPAAPIPAAPVPVPGAADTTDPATGPRHAAGTP
jgi:hypothetical protein